MSVETERSSTESSAASGLDFEDTALTLRLPGSSSSSSSSSSEPDRKRASTSEDDPDRRGSTATESPPSPKARVVGWPPVRAFRKNALAASASAAVASSKVKFVKVAVDGAPYLRKVDLEAYPGYDQLLAALQDKFVSHFTIREYLAARHMPAFVPSVLALPLSRAGCVRGRRQARERGDEARRRGERRRVRADVRGQRRRLDARRRRPLENVCGDLPTYSSHEKLRSSQFRCSTKICSMSSKSLLLSLSSMRGRHLCLLRFFPVCERNVYSHRLRLLVPSCY